MQFNQNQQYEQCLLTSNNLTPTKKNTTCNLRANPFARSPGQVKIMKEFV